MPSSIIVALRKAVTEGLADNATLQAEKVDVSYGWDPKSKKRYQIFTANPRGDHEPAALKPGRVFRKETATFRLVVHVEEPGADAEEADEKAIEFGQVVEEFIADNRFADGAVPGLNWLRVQSWEMNGGPADGRSFISQLIYVLSYDARLT